MKNDFAQSILQRLQVCIAGLLDISPGEVKPEMSLMDDLGIDSLDLLELTVLVKKEFQVQIPIQHWMREITSMTKDLTSENLTEKIDQLSASTGLEFSTTAIAELGELIDQSATDFDQARTVVAMIKVEMIHHLLLMRLAPLRTDIEAGDDGVKAQQLLTDSSDDGVEEMQRAVGQL